MVLPPHPQLPDAIENVPAHPTHQVAEKVAGVEAIPREGRYKGEIEERVCVEAILGRRRRDDDPPTRAMVVEERRMHKAGGSVRARV